jgi:hypothetical protein
MAKFAEAYVTDAFDTAHRAHASTAGIAKFAGLGSPVFNRSSSGMSRQTRCQARMPILYDRCTLDEAANIIIGGVPD